MPDVRDLLRKLSERTITPAEEAYLFRWLSENREEWALELLEAYWRVVREKEQYLSDARSELLLGAIYRQIGVIPPDASLPFRKRNTYSVVKPVWKYAGAALVFLALLAGGLWYFQNPAAAGAPGRSAVPTVVAGTKEHCNTGGNIMPLTLPDGSSVWLYPRSSLRFPDRFGESERRVALQGKAFFEVLKDRKKPFVVVSGEMETVVLGTSFVVNAFEEQPRFSVHVRTGKVAVRATSAARQGVSPTARAVALHAREYAIFNRGTSRFVSDRTPEASRVAPGLQPDYRFRETPVTEILAVLEKDYGIPIFVDAAALESCALTTTLTEQTFFEKLRIICEGIGPGTSFTLEGESVIFHSPGCNN